MIPLLDDEVNRMDFAAKVRYAREQLKISQEKLALALHVSYTAVNRWENSKNIPNKLTQKVFYSYCKENGVKFDDDDKPI
jgi:DNA-binding transcriptional regulator YiaG